MRHVSNRELLDTVRAWCAANYPACPLEYVALHLRYLPVPIQLAAGMPTQAESVGERFLPTPFQQAILDALDGKALRTDALAAVVGDRPRLFRPKGGIKELQEHGMVAHHQRRGYYRPDAPPPELEPEDDA